MVVVTFAPELITLLGLYEVQLLHHCHIVNLLSNEKHDESDDCLKNLHETAEFNG